MADTLLIVDAGRWIGETAVSGERLTGIIENTGTASAPHWPNDRCRLLRWPAPICNPRRGRDADLAPPLRERCQGRSLAGMVQAGYCSDKVQRTHFAASSGQRAIANEAVAVDWPVPTGHRPTTRRRGDGQVASADFMPQQRRRAAIECLVVWARRVRSVFIRSKGAGTMSMQSTQIWVWREGQTAPIDGFDVEATDGSIGTIDEATYEVGGSYFVVDTGPWIFGKKVLLPAGVVERVDYDNGDVYVGLTKDQIKNSPEFDKSTYRDDAYRASVADYYRQYGSRNDC